MEDKNYAVFERDSGEDWSQWTAWMSLEEAQALKEKFKLEHSWMCFVIFHKVG